MTTPPAHFNCRSAVLPSLVPRAFVGPDGISTNMNGVRVFRGLMARLRGSVGDMTALRWDACRAYIDLWFDQPDTRSAWHSWLICVVPGLDLTISAAWISMTEQHARRVLEVCRWVRP